MLFPVAQRVVYDRNTLQEVICQFRFPPILRIDTEIPAKYQEEIRGEYPLFMEPQGAATSLGIPPEIAKIIGGELPFKIGKSAEFLSADERWKVALTREFLALSTGEYRRWGVMKEHLQRPLDALISVYNPAFFTRIGLRYRNVIKRSMLGLNGSEWSDLCSIQQYWAC